MPLPPPEDTLPIQPVQAAHERALMMLGRVAALAAEPPDPYLISRTLSRREAVDSSAIEGTNSTFDDLLTVEEDDGDGGRTPCAAVSRALYRGANRDGYYAALKMAQQRLEWAPLVGYLSDAITGTVEELFATQSALDALKADWLKRRKYRAQSAALRALDLLIDYSVITMARLAAINQLGGAGILVERTGYRRNRIFAAQDVLAIVNRPFGQRLADKTSDRPWRRFVAGHRLASGFTPKCRMAIGRP